MIKDFQKDYYTGLKGVYFYRILKTIIELGQLDKLQGIILDYGAGVGKLKKTLGKKVINYDVLPALSDVSDWRKVKFDAVVANEVLSLMTESDIRNLLKQIRQINKDALLVVGMAREKLISEILAVLAGERDAHADSKTPPTRQKEILEEFAQIVDHRSVFGLCDVYKLRFR